MDNDPRAVALASDQAHDWLDRLKNPGPHDHAGFVEWLKSSALNVRELLLAAALDTSLRGIDRHRAVEVQALVARAGNVVATAANTSVQWPSRPSGRAATRGAGVGRMARSWKGAAAIAALGLAALGAVSVDRVLSERFIVTEPSEWRTRRLSDGTKVTVGPRTRLRLDLSEGTRHIHLSGGDALFEVAHDLTRPFVVHAQGVEARALGTVFAVSELAHTVRVTVAEGSVAVTRSGQAPVRLGGGQHITLMDGKPSAVTTVDASVELAWARGQLIFSGATLGEAARQFNRLNRMQLDVADSKLAAQTVFGTFQADDPESFAEVMLHSPHPDRIVRTQKRGRIRLGAASPGDSRPPRED